MSDNILHQWARHIISVKKIRKEIIAKVDFKQGDRVIDIGCGTGDLLAEIYNTYGDRLEYLGIEPDERLRAEAERLYGGRGIRFKRAFANHLPSIQDYYTHVICMVSFHHFPREDWQACFRELVRVLAPGGRLIIVEFGRPQGFLGRILWLINRSCRKLSHGLEDFLRAEAGNSGLHVISEQKQFGYITHLVFTK